MPQHTDARTGPADILVVDDGEWTDVRERLRELGASYLEADALDAPGAPARVSLLITNVRHALKAAGRGPCVDTHLVLYDEVSRTLRKVLERTDCDLVLRHPVNPSVFRLLVRQALYDGPERRRGRRVVVSSPVEMKQGRRKLRGALTQLSLRGCGVTMDVEPRLGSELVVTLPAELTGGAPLQASGPVLAVRPSEAEPGRQDVAVGFRLMDVGARRVIHKVMQQHGSSTPKHPRGEAGAPGKAETGGAERRSGPRKAFTRRVLAAGAGVSHVLIGRDLSAGGMRIRPEPSLEPGATLKLAVHARPGMPAVMLKAQVVRDDGDDGLVLRFLGVPPGIAARLEQMVAELPSLPTGKRAGSRAAPGVVVSEVMDRR